MRSRIPSCWWSIIGYGRRNFTRDRILQEELPMSSSTRKFSLVRPLILLTDRNLLCPIGMMVGLCRKCRQQVFRLSCRRSALLHVRKPEDASLILPREEDVNGPGSLDRPVANYCL